jgi:hypothetical protein
MTPSKGELQHELERLLGSRVEALTRRPHAYRASFGLERIRVVLEDGRRLSLVRKELSRRSLDENARRAKPADLHDPLREIDVYAHILSAHPVGTPSYIGATVAPEHDRYWLFLEEVPGDLLWQHADPETWRNAARWSANLQDRIRPRCASLLRYDRELLRRLLAPDRVSPPLRQTVEHVLAGLVDAPVGFLHGDFYPSNIVVGRGNDRGRICVLDWEAAGVGPRLLDLASLVAGWPEADVAAIADAYRTTLTDPPPREGFLRELDLCRLCVAVRWIGWSRDWIPPDEHAHDWNGAALQLAERLAG